MCRFCTEEIVKYKQAFRGIDEQRPLNSKSKQKKNLNWLIVSVGNKEHYFYSLIGDHEKAQRLSNQPARFKIHGEYRTEEIAFKALQSIHDWRGIHYIVCREMYNRVYKDMVI